MVPANYPRRFKMWSQQTSLSLIEDLQSVPCLWDVNAPEYKDRAMRSEAYEALALKYGVTQVEIEKKIQALKNQFRREHKKILEMRLRGSYNRQGVWFGYESLSFLLPSYEPRRSRSTDDDSQENNSTYYQDYEVDDNPVDDAARCFENFPQIKEFSIPRPSKRMIYAEGPMDDSAERINGLVNSFSKRDEFTVYGEHIANKLRNCGRPGLEIASAQNEIDNICFKLILGEYSLKCTPGKHNHAENVNELSINKTSEPGTSDVKEQPKDLPSVMKSSN